MARQIARLQLPVLRVALGDSTFFSSRRHPVRRFVNRIASLACAFDDFDDGPGQQFLGRVRELVQEIVEGDFDQIELYAAKLAELEALHRRADRRSEVERRRRGRHCSRRKESELRLQQRYMLQLQAALGAGGAAALPARVPAAGLEPGAGAGGHAATARSRERAKRYRRAGRDLVMSMQPKGSPAMRKKFLMQLPPLMKDLNEGMALIGWPEPAQKDFFAKLLPAHAESLKAQAMRELDYNLLVKQLEAIFDTPVPGAETLSAAESVPESTQRRIAEALHARGGEAGRPGRRKRGRLGRQGRHRPRRRPRADDRAGIAGPDDADRTVALTRRRPSQLGPTNLEQPAEPAEPTRGPQLIDHMQLGFAYQMHLKDEWQKVRLDARQPGPQLLRLHARRQAPGNDLDDVAHARPHVRDRPHARLRERLPDGARDRSARASSWPR